MEKKLFVPITKRDSNDVSTSIHPTKTTDCTNVTHDPRRLLRLPQVLALIPVSKSCWWQWVRDGKAPHRFTWEIAALVGVMLMLSL